MKLSDSLPWLALTLGGTNVLANSEQGPTSLTRRYAYFLPPEAVRADSSLWNTIFPADPGITQVVDDYVKALDAAPHTSQMMKPLPESRQLPPGHPEYKLRTVVVIPEIPKNGFNEKYNKTLSTLREVTGALTEQMQGERVRFLVTEPVLNVDVEIDERDHRLHDSHGNDGTETAQHVLIKLQILSDIKDMDGAMGSTNGTSAWVGGVGLRETILLNTQGASLSC